MNVNDIYGGDFLKAADLRGQAVHRLSSYIGVVHK